MGMISNILLGLCVVQVSAAHREWTCPAPRRTKTGQYTVCGEQHDDQESDRPRFERKMSRPVDEFGYEKMNCKKELWCKKCVRKYFHKRNGLPIDRPTKAHNPFLPHFKWRPDPPVEQKKVVVARKTRKAKSECIIS